MLLIFISLQDTKLLKEMNSNAATFYGLKPLPVGQNFLKIQRVNLVDKFPLYII